MRTTAIIVGLFTLVVVYCFLIPQLVIMLGGIWGIQLGFMKVMITVLLVKSIQIFWAMTDGKEDK